MAETKDELVKKELTPKKEAASKEQLSNFKIKDSHFNKKKTYIEKNKKGSSEKTIDATWRHININGVQMTVHKDEPLTKKQYKAFEIAKTDLEFEKERKKTQQEYWLEQIKKPAKKTVAEK